MNVNKEMNPCHRPAKKPAGASSNWMLPGAQEVRKKIAKMKKGNHLLISECFMIYILWTCENNETNSLTSYMIRSDFIFF